MLHRLGDSATVSSRPNLHPQPAIAPHRSKNMDSADLLKVAATWPSTVALRNLLHWSQLWQAAAGLRMYDFGTDCDKKPASKGRAFEESCNQAKYGQEDPPGYDLSQVTCPAAVFAGEAAVQQGATSIVHSQDGCLRAATMSPCQAHKAATGPDPAARAIQVMLTWSRLASRPRSCSGIGMRASSSTSRTRALREYQFGCQRTRSACTPCHSACLRCAWPLTGGCSALLLAYCGLQFPGCKDQLQPCLPPSLLFCCRHMDFVW